MKLYFYTVLLLVSNFVLFGSLLPMLISAASYEAVIAGFILIILVPVMDFFIVKKLFTLARQLTKKPEINNETH